MPRDNTTPVITQRVITQAIRFDPGGREDGGNAIDQQPRPMGVTGHPDRPPRGRPDRLDQAGSPRQTPSRVGNEWGNDHQKQQQHR
jgi:hypothetical protein